MNDSKWNKTDAQERPTLRTIARISGLAVATVSRALGDAPDISANTKEKVRKIAKDVGYIPNRAGVRLRTGQTNVIGLVLETEYDIMNMTSRLIASIANGLRGTRYHLVMTAETPDQDPLEAVRYIVETRSADAVIINRIQPEDARVKYLLQRNFPFVTHGRTVWSEKHAYFDYDNEAFGRLAVETLAGRGRSKILLLAPPTDQNYAREMIKGAISSAKGCDVDLIVADGFTSDSERSIVSQGMTKSLLRFPGLDAVISASPNATMVATSAIENAGLTIGSDFDIFSKETVPFLKLFRPSILSMQEDVEKAGLFLAKAAMHEITRQGGDHLQEIDRPRDATRDAHAIA